MAFVPGLKRTEHTRLLTTRRLPIPGEVLVKEGDTVDATTNIAKTIVPGNRQIINVGYLLGRSGINVRPFMHKKEGDLIESGEIIASRIYNKYILFGRTKSICRAPSRGLIDYIFLDGRIVFAEPTPVEISAFVPGTVTTILPNEGAIIETLGAYIQGIFGFGGVNYGELIVLSESPEDTLTAEQIGTKFSGKIIVGGALVEGEALEKAAKVGVKGIVAGGINDKDVIDFLGYEIGVGITGEEEIDLTVVITEGFGNLNMAVKTFDILKKFEGTHVSVIGATQIRAGVLRPEIIIPRSDIDSKDLAEVREDKKHLSEGLKPGTSIKIIREPYFGALGHVVSLPIERQAIQTESKVRVLEAELTDGRRVIVPRANVEVITE